MDRQIIERKLKNADLSLQNYDILISLGYDEDPAEKVRLVQDIAVYKAMLANFDRDDYVQQELDEQQLRNGG